MQQKRRLPLTTAAKRRVQLAGGSLGLQQNPPNSREVQAAGQGRCRCPAAAAARQGGERPRPVVRRPPLRSPL